MNTTMFLMMGIPVIGACLLYYLAQNDLVADYGRLKSLCFIPLISLPGMLLVLLAFAISFGSAVHDTEIWSGVVTSKERKHDSYTRSYDCNCSTTTVGSGKDARTVTTCQTCVENHYTVKWTCNSTIGTYKIAEEDSTSQSVYRLPDPPRWLQIKPGDPAAKTHSYTNYVQAVPDSLFKPSSDTLKTKFARLVPAYPDTIYDLYKIDRFVSPGFNFVDVAAWNQDISNMLRELGSKKQVNVIVVVVKTNDPNYMYALRDAWEGANKNDVVVLIGSEDGVKIEWTDVISWTKKELFKIELRDNLMALGTIDRTKIMPVIEAQIVKNFERRHMSEFKYLSSEIEPPAWALWVLGVVLSAAYAILAFNITGKNRFMNFNFPRKFHRRW
jgi:hypothetical protein